MTDVMSVYDEIARRSFHRMHDIYDFIYETNDENLENLSLLISLFNSNETKDLVQYYIGLIDGILNQRSNLCPMCNADHESGGVQDMKKCEDLYVQKVLTGTTKSSASSGVSSLLTTGQGQYL